MQKPSHDPLPDFAKDEILSLAVEEFRGACQEMIYAIEEFQQSRRQICIERRAWIKEISVAVARHERVRETARAWLLQLGSNAVGMRVRERTFGFLL